MARIYPFPALRPRPDLAAQICELPYDVMSSTEARLVAAGNPLSFLRVSKPEIDLPPGASPYDPITYTIGRKNFKHLIDSHALQLDPQPCFYLYRQTMGTHSQLGLVAVLSCEDYQHNVIKKHELTQPEKEEDRARHINALNAQTGPAFLVYRAHANLSQQINPKAAEPPELDFIAKDSVRHTAWIIRDREHIQRIQAEFAQVTSLYIADGHHRSAAAARVWQARHGSGKSAFFLGVIFPHDQVQILPYNRILADLNGLTPARLLEKLQAVFIIQSNGVARPKCKHQVSLYLDGHWLTLRFRDEFTSAKDPFESLDVNLLQQHVLMPLFGIDDPRTSKRLDFVGGIRGSAELEQRVNSGAYACAFSIYPTQIEDLMAIADAGRIMPPKSTWFEPKLRDGMFCHLLTPEAELDSPK